MASNKTTTDAVLKTLLKTNNKKRVSLRLHTFLLEMWRWWWRENNKNVVAVVVVVVVEGKQ